MDFLRGPHDFYAATFSSSSDHGHTNLSVGARVGIGTPRTDSGVPFRLRKISRLISIQRIVL